MTTVGSGFASPPFLHAYTSVCSVFFAITSLRPLYLARRSRESVIVFTRCERAPV